MIEATASWSPVVTGLVKAGSWVGCSFHPQSLGYISRPANSGLLLNVHLPKDKSADMIKSNCIFQEAEDPNLLFQWILSVFVILFLYLDR